MKKLNYHSDFDVNFNDAYNTTFNAISVRGNRHRKNDSYNQDYFKCNIKNQIKYVIVADGLGSAKYSHIGSQKAVNLLEQMIKESNFDEDSLTEFDITAFNMKFIESWKSNFADNLKDFDTTLLYLIILKRGVLIGSIGDGLILYSLKNEIIYIKDEKNNFSNQTYSLASDNALSYFNAIYTPIQFANQLPTIFILTTDGVSDDLKPEMLNNLPNYLYEELKEKGVIRMQKVIGDWILNWETQNHSDDRTFCMLVMEKAGNKV